MNRFKQPENFNASLVELKGSNLIEASAGTGKTYSIAILLLRLLIETKIPINEVLMVTFTKAAVAELEERIRIFVRNAYKVSMGKTIGDDTITKLVEKAIEQEGEENVQSLLRTAIIFLDETSVLTIHSFCQQTLTGFAFETNQLFGAETLQDTSAILNDEVNKFWRENITTIPKELLGFLIKGGMSRDVITAIVNEHINGKKYIDFDPGKSNECSISDFEKMLLEIKAIGQKEAEARIHLIDFIKNNKVQITDWAKGNKYVNEKILPGIDEPEEFIRSIWSKRELVNVKKVFDTTLIPQIKQCEDVADESHNYIIEAIAKINCFAIKKITTGLNNYKQRNNLLAFDDMIVNLHKAVNRMENSLLIKALRNKYKAVFIDEFQDTDRMQYEIFQKTFGEETILFYIGDPKQLIYAWRKADIFTYFKAKEQVRRIYHMNQNFRSSAPLIYAMNDFFLPNESFDTFYFNNAEHAITYLPVESPKENTKGELLNEQQPVTPISILPFSNKNEIEHGVALKVAELLTNNYVIKKDKNERFIAPADIGILVRTNFEGQSIKSALAAKGIPAVTINDSKVLQTPEAAFMLYLLQAINQLSISNINKALLSPFTGYRIQDILELDDEKTIQLFRNYKALWEEDGIYTALIQFVADYDVKNILLSRHTENGERIITNLFQLIELIHKIQNDKQYSQAELISWLQRCIEGMETEGDQYEQRIESDEASVKIVTIHKSKGLEYKIVLMPYVDFQMERKSGDFSSFRHPITGEYVTVEKSRLSDEQKEWLKEQTEQENRRLLYVAVTRAVYKCYIFQNTYYKNSTLATFVTALNNKKSEGIDFNEKVLETDYFAIKQQNRPSQPYQKVHFELDKKYWSRISYTLLAAKGEPGIKPRGGVANSQYDHFIFNELPRGAKTGNMLHHIFENINFSNEQSWPYHIGNAIKKFAPRNEKEYLPMLQQLLLHVTKASIDIGGSTFSLDCIINEQRLNELEFDFNVPLFSPAALNNFSTDSTMISIKHFEQAEGIMNGKVDMFFEHNGKYYILDWKSNYLGDDVQYYQPAAMNEAMNESNYHLQYLIYTVAVKKYLQSRLPSFDYEQHFGGVIYMFVRGVRSQSNAGIFITRPMLNQIASLEALVSI